MDPTPGSQSSEYSTTKLTVWLGIAATVVGVLTDLLQNLSSAMPGSKWLGPLLAVLGVAGSVLATLGYQYTRSQVKIAAHAAAGEATKTDSDAAAAKLGQA